MDDDSESSALHRVYLSKQMQTAKPEKCHDVSYGNKESRTVFLLGGLNLYKSDSQ